jgi:ribosomal-protein-alanine N-acetyltransferase
MLAGNQIKLRLVREADLKLLYEVLQDLSNRGAYYPLSLTSEPQFIRDFRETGFWTPERGTLLIVDSKDIVVGRVLYYPTVPYLSELELGYHLFDTAQAGKGIVTEALRLLVRYLFATRSLNRLRLVIDTENLASRRVAEKCSFRHEGTTRGAWFHQGRYRDVEVYALLRDEAVDLREAAST